MATPTPIYDDQKDGDTENEPSWYEDAKRDIDNLPETEGSEPSTPEEYEDAEKDKEKKSLDGDELKEKENEGGLFLGGNSSSGSLPNENQNFGLDGLYTSTNTGNAATAKLFTRRRKLIGGGAVGVMVGGALLFFTYSSGPLQFIHFAQLMRQFHFTNQENAADDRLTKITRFIRYQNAPEKTRLSIVGNRVADTLESKLNSSGIESRYTERFGYQDGYFIDPAKFGDNPEFADLQGKSNAEIQAHFKERFNVDVTVDSASGKLKIDGDNLKYREFKLLNKNLLQAAGYSVTTSAIGSRVMGKRAGIDWHPIKKLDNKLLTSIDLRLSAWQKERAQRINEGVDTNAKGTATDKATKKDQKTGKDTAETQTAQTETDQTISQGSEAHAEIETGTSNGPKLSALRESVGFKIGGGVAAAVGVACTIKGIADNIDVVKYANVVLPLMRMGMEMVTVGNQVMNGKDVNPEQLSFYAKQLFSKDNGSWTNARSIQAELGQDQTGPDIRDEARIDNSKNIVSEFVASIPGIGGVCQAANSGIGQAVSFGIDLLGGPISALVGQGFSAFVAPQLIEGLVGWIAGSPISTAVAGADFGNYVNFGTRLASNETSVSRGGVELTPAQSLALKQDRLATERQEFAQKSIFDRYLDVNSNQSLIAKIIDSQNPNPSMYAQNIAKAPLQSFISLAKMPFTLFGNKTSAATDYSYGFPEYGFDLGDLENGNVSNPFDNAAKANAILNGGQGSDFKERAKKCFGVSFDTDNNVVESGKTAPSYEMPSNCTDKSLDWTRVRFYIFDTQVMESAACYEGVGDSCAKVGFGNNTPNNSSSTTSTASDQIVGDPYQSSVDVACAPGTNDLGINDAYSDGVLIKMRLCALTNLPSSGQESKPGDPFYVQGANGLAIVNSRVSGAWFKLVNDAKAAGHVLTSGSSYRTMVHQQDLFNKVGGDTARVAKPGYSSHQAGVAIDFAGMGSNASPGLTCDNRQTSSNPSWAWLRDNAETYGFKQYAAEAWHWDALPLPNRCGTPQNTPVIKRF